MDIVQESIPVSMRWWFLTGSRVLTTLFIVSYTTPLFLIAAIPLGIMYFFIQVGLDPLIFWSLESLHENLKQNRIQIYSALGNYLHSCLEEQPKTIAGYCSTYMKSCTATTSSISAMPLHNYKTTTINRCPSPVAVLMMQVR